MSSRFSAAQRPRCRSRHARRLRASCRPSGTWATTLRVGVPWTTRFVKRLRELGWSEGHTIAIEYRWSEGRPERVAEIAAAFVRQSVDVIVTYGGAVTTLKQVTAATPIVFAIAVDPVGSGMVASLSHPGSNVTGLSVEQSDIAGKRLQLLREVVPGLRRLAIVYDAGYPAALRENDEAQAAARTFGLDVAPHGIRRAEDIAPAFEAIKSQADAVYVAVDALVNANRTQIATLALNARPPTSFNESGCVQAGGLMSYGPNFSDLFRRAGEIVDKILGCQAGRHSGRTADQVRVRDQYEDGEDAWTDRTLLDAIARRRGNRIARQICCGA